MKKVRLNGKKMSSVGTTHQYLQKKLDLPDYYGANLDALWDILSTWSDPQQIILINLDALKASLGDYGDKLILVFSDAAQANSRLLFRIVHTCF